MRDYWSGYEPRAAKLDPRPRTLADYVHLAQRRRVAAVDCADAVRTVGKGLAELVHILGLDAPPAGGQAVRWIWESIERDPSVVPILRTLLWDWCVELTPVTEPVWAGQVDRLRRAIRPIIGDRSTKEADAFCQWSAEFEGQPNAGNSPGRGGPNRYRFVNGHRFVDIDVGTIHSAKGQTHTATLVLETFSWGYDLEDVMPWLLGEKRGADATEGPRRLERLRLIYTAMTRPTHLVCLAMRQDAPGKGSLAAANLERLRSLGWKIQLLS